MNDYNVIGRLVKDPKMLTNVNGKPYAVFTIAKDVGVNRYKKTMYLDCISYTAVDYIVSKFRSGHLIGVLASLSPNEYNLKDGTKVKGFRLEIRNVTRLQFDKESTEQIQYRTVENQEPESDSKEEEDVPF